LTQNDVKQKIAIQCIENNIAVFSHHTAIDAKNGGVNDWLVNGLGDVKSNVPIQQATSIENNESFKVTL
jgi:putative NIF3 family GTP cyclohydrolase 1 type 2